MLKTVVLLNVVVFLMEADIHLFRIQKNSIYLKCIYIYI